MRAEELQVLIRARPFVPLRLHMAGGQTCDIAYHYGVLVLRDWVDVGVIPDPRTGVAHRVERCLLADIVRVERLEPPGGGAGEPGT